MMMQYITDPLVMIPVGFGIAAVHWWIGSYYLWKVKWLITSKLVAIAGGGFAGFGVVTAVIGQFLI